MPPTVAEVLSALGQRAPWDKAFAWDPVGLQIGDPARPVERAAVCHEVTEAVVDAVLDDPPHLLVTYHPLLFQPTNRLVAGATAAGRALRLAGAGVALAVAHTSFDVAAGGTADALADALDLEGVSGFGPAWGPESVKVTTFVSAEHVERVAGAMADAGGGVIGNYTGCSFRAAGSGAFLAGTGTEPVTGEAGRFNTEPEVRVEMNAPAGRLDAVVAALVAAHPYEEPAYDVVDRRGDAGFVGRIGDLAAPVPLAALAGHVAERVGGVLRVAGDPAGTVARVAVVPGAGSEFAGAARSAGAHVLVTGDVSHHRARQALDRGLCIVDPGHVPSERPGVERLYAAVCAAAPEVADLTGVATSPWNEEPEWTS